MFWQSCIMLWGERRRSYSAQEPRDLVDPAGLEVAAPLPAGGKSQWIPHFAFLMHTASVYLNCPHPNPHGLTLWPPWFSLAWVGGGE